MNTTRAPRLNPYDSDQWDPMAPPTGDVDFILAGSLQVGMNIGWSGLTLGQWSDTWSGSWQTISSIDGPVGGMVGVTFADTDTVKYYDENEFAIVVTPFIGAALANRREARS